MTPLSVSPVRKAGGLATQTEVEYPLLPSPAVRKEAVAGVAGWVTFWASTASGVLEDGVTDHPEPCTHVAVGRSR